MDRLLQSPKAAAFTENFTGQWLRLRDIDFTEPSTALYPEFDDMLKVSMVREARLFFDELLRHDLSLTNFLASDFSMLNGRLAKHYGIPGVDGMDVPARDASAGESPRRRAHDGGGFESHGERHEHLARDARRVGARPHLRHARRNRRRPTPAASSPTSAAPRRFASNSPSTAVSSPARAAM